MLIGRVEKWVEGCVDFNNLATAPCCPALSWWGPFHCPCSTHTSCEIEICLGGEGKRVCGEREREGVCGERERGKEGLW